MKWEDYAREHGLIPEDNGQPLRRLRIWNIKNGLVVTFGIWAFLVAGFIWFVTRH